MKIEGARAIPASPAVVWSTLLDPVVLKESIPGCEALEKTNDNTFEAAVTIKVGPVKAKFAGKVELSELDEPRSCVISGQGSGGVAGFAKGGAVIKLTPTDDGCKLTYEGNVDIGGKIASLGDRLFRGVVEKNVNQFFDNVVTTIQGIPASVKGPEFLRA